MVHGTYKKDGQTYKTEQTAGFNIQKNSSRYLWNRVKNPSLPVEVCQPNAMHMKVFPDFFHTTSDEKAATIQISDEAEACAAVLMACLRANELDSDAENAAFYTTIKSRNIFKGRDAADLVAVAGRYYEKAGGSAALINAAMGAIREQTRLPLFYHCLDVILADGVVTPLEHRVFQYLKTKFRVDDEVAWTAMEVLLEKNKL